MHMILSVVVVLLILPGINGKNVSSCNETINAKCTPLQIVFISINAKTDLAAKILEECNGHEKCQVQNPGRECLQLQYGCKKNQGQTLAVKQSSKFQLNGDLSIFSLMSVGYLMGQYIEARSIKCNLTLPQKENDITMQIKVVVKEFAPYASSTDYCFYISDKQEPTICSGIGHTYKEVGPFQSTNRWQFSMNFRRSTFIVPQVRFWISMYISPIGRSMDLDCSSHAVNDQANEDVAYNTIPVMAAVLGAILLSLLTFAIAWYCRNHKLGCSWKASHALRDTNDYDYIDIGEVARSRIDGERRIDTIISNTDNLQALTQSMGNLMEPRSVHCELLPYARKWHSTDQSLDKTDSLNHPLPHSTGSILNRELPPIPSPRYITNPTSNLNPSHIMNSAQRGNEIEKENPGGDFDEDDEYLPPKMLLDSDPGEMLDATKIGTCTLSNDGACFKINDIKDDLETDAQEHEDQQADDADYNYILENKYMGLSEGTLCDSENSSRSSTGILYTLLPDHESSECIGTNDTPGPCGNPCECDPAFSTEDAEDTEIQSVENKKQDAWKPENMK